MIKYILICSDPENRENKILTIFESSRENLVENFVKNTEFVNYFNETDYFYLADSFLISDVENIFTKEFIDNVTERKNIDAVQEEFQSKLKLALDIIDNKEGLLNFFDEIRIGNTKNLFLIEDYCGIWYKLEKNGFFS